MEQQICELSPGKKDKKNRAEQYGKADHARYSTEALFR